MKRKYGWKPDLADPRDIMYRDKVVKLMPIKTVMLSDKFKMPPIYDQGQQGSCTGHGWKACAEFLALNGLIPTVISALPRSAAFQYANERIADGTFPEDAGSSIRQGAEVFRKLGICSNTTFPYSDKICNKKPTTKIFTEALKFKLPGYQRANNTNKQELVDCLQRGLPIVFGMNVYIAFESAGIAKTGQVPMPKGQSIGGHCMMIVGYTLDTDKFTIQNSWGENWGIKGYCYIPAAYLTNLKYASDFAALLLP